MERVKPAPRARKKAVEPTPDIDVHKGPFMGAGVDINKAETVTPLPKGGDIAQSLASLQEINASAGRIPAQAYEYNTVTSEIKFSEERWLQIQADQMKRRADVFRKEEAERLAKAENPKPQRPRTWWELLWS